MHFLLRSRAVGFLVHPPTATASDLGWACVVMRSGRARPATQVRRSERVGVETVLSSDPLDRVGRADRGAHRRAAQAQDEVHGEVDEPP
jgi:hypothetical protein